MSDDARRTERRTVRSRDPSLSPQANRVLTEELRAVTGDETVQVPVDRPHPDRGRHGGRRGLVVGLVSNRLAIAMTFLGALVVGAVVSLATGSWWFLLLALAVHAVATIAIVGLILGMTTETEHLSPTAAALLEDEGVSDPDGVFSDLVEEFSEEDRGHADRREAPSDGDAADAATDQRSSITPSQDPSRPVGP
jgi:hypothetical protein